MNCDDESNKAFCGGMGVKGFPTLKIIKPSKTAGKPIVEEYQGARTASGIVEAVKLAIPNHVKRISDKSLSAYLVSNNDTAKAILFSEKGTTGALIKVLALELGDTMKFAQIRNKETAAVEMFGVTEYPSLLVLPGGNQEPVKFEGPFSKSAMKAFLSQHISSKSAEPSKKQKPIVKEPEKKQANNEAKSATDSSTFSEASASASSASFDVSEDATEATTITLGDPAEPTESPNPMAAPEDAPKPVVVHDLPPPIPALIEERHLQVQCLGDKTTTCILALLPKAAEVEEVIVPDVSTALASLAEVADKHVQRGSKLFPFYSIPARNPGAATLRDALKLQGDDQLELIAVNSRRGWWRQYKGDGFDVKSIENWVDNIRFGEGEKGKLPDMLVVTEKSKEETPVSEKLEETATPDTTSKEKPVVPEHGEL